MKKVPSILFGFLSLSALAGCAGNEPETPKHTHNYTEHAEVSATCVSDGMEKYYTCDECGKVFDKDKNETTLDQIASIEAEGHNRILTSWETNADEHWHKCSKCETLLDKGEHEFEPVSDSATCTEDGVVTYECEVCGKEKTEPSTKKGHTWDNGTETKPSTCTEQGVITYHCTVPGCNGEKTTNLPLAEHVFDVTKTPVEHKDPTCTEDGYDKYKCDNCTEIKTATITKTGHKASSAWDYDAEKHWHNCENTGCEEHVSEANHVANDTWETDASNHWKQCTSECGVELAKGAHSITNWTESVAPTKTTEGEEQGTCDVCGRLVKRTIAKLVPSPADMIAKIEALGTEPKVMLIDKIAETYADLELMEAADKALVTNISALDQLKADTEALATNVIGVRSKDIAVTTYSKKELSVVEDETFGRVFDFEIESAAWQTIKFSASDIDDSAFGEIGMLGFYVNCDDQDDILKFEVVSDWTGGEKGAPLAFEDAQKRFAFYDRTDKSCESILNLNLYKNVFGNPGNGWKLVVLNVKYTAEVLNSIKENGYFGIKISCNGVVGSEGSVKFTSLFGLKDFVLDAGADYYRAFTNSYSSQLPSWAAGDTINSKYNKAANVAFMQYQFHNMDQGLVRGSTYSYTSGHDTTVNDYFTYETRLAYTGSDAVLNAWYYVYSNMESVVQIHYGNSGAYPFVTLHKGINRINVALSDLSAFTPEKQNVTFNFKNAKSEPTWAPGQQFEMISNIYASIDVSYAEGVIADINALPEHPKAMDMNAVNRVKANFDKLSVTEQARVENIDKLERILEETSNYVAIITPRSADGKLETYNGGVKIGDNVADSTFGEVFAVSDADSSGGQWRTFRLSAKDLGDVDLDQIAMLGLFVKSATNSTYFNLTTKIWNSKVTVPQSINDTLIDPARFANKDESSKASITSFPIYENTFGNPGNGWELCTISVQYTKTIIKELKENGEISFSPSNAITSANGEFYVAGLFGIKTSGAMPTTDIKQAYCFNNGWEVIDNSGTGISKTNHGQNDPTFDRAVWPTGPAGYQGEVRLDNIYYTFTNNNEAGSDALSGYFIYTKGASVDSSRSWSSLYVYIYVKYATKVQLSVCGQYNNNYVDLNAGLNLVKLSDKDIAALKAMEGTADEGTDKFKMLAIFREGNKIPAGQVIYMTGIYGVQA